MNLAIDIGNTNVKWGCFEGGVLSDEGRWDGGGEVPESLGTALHKAKHTLVCASGDMSMLQLDVPVLDAAMPLPLHIDYRTPATLGADRLAAACGAHALHKGEACLVIDAGTCITVDYVDATGTYHGGAIMPGLRMNLQALHTFTDKLPLIDIKGVERAPVLGRSTEESIVAGTLGATMLALAGYVALYRAKEPQIQVLLTGGDAEQLAASGTNGWEVVPTLTLIGLNEVMQHNDRHRKA